MPERHDHVEKCERGRLGPPALDYLVFACAKSGTTWMQRLLSAHPEIHCAETRLFGRHFDGANPSGPNITLESYVRNLARHYHAPVGQGKDADAFYLTMLFSLTDAIGQTARAAGGKPIYGEKLTPYLGTGDDVIERLHAYHAGIRLIHLVRDGRDVVVSGAVQWSNLRLRTADAARASEIRDALDRRVVLDEPFEFFTSLWIESVRAGRAAAERFESSMTIRYEDLLESPDERIGGVLRFIGADDSMHAIERCRAAASFEALSGGRRAGQEDRSSFFRSGRAGDWRGWLSDAQREAFASRAGDLLGSFGYEKASPARVHIGAEADWSRERRDMRGDARGSGMVHPIHPQTGDRVLGGDTRSPASLAHTIDERETLRRRLIEQTAAFCDARGYRRIVLYGAGRHTLPIVRQPWQWHDVRVMAILDDNPSIESLRGVPVVRPVDLPVRVPGAGGRAGIDAVVISSDVHERAMVEACARHAALDGIPVVRIYGDAYPMRESPASLTARLVEAWGISEADATWLVENRDERHDATLPMLPPERTELHLRRYEFAARLARGARVIDAACGTGYGSHLLRTQGGAAQVVGVDLDRTAIDYATRRFGMDGILFRSASATATGLPDASFDLATSFETVEHVVDAAGLLDEFWRLLRPGGTLVLSTPNDSGLTKHHVHSFTRESLEALVARRFEATAWYGQWADAAPTMDGPAAGIRPLGDDDKPGYFIVVAQRA